MLGYVAVMIMSINLVYSFSAFKNDLGKTFKWDEVTLAHVFFFANLGQNFVVHYGLLYDAAGYRVT